MEDLVKKAIEAVLEQGKPSISADGGCMYRNGDLKCAVGHLIPDEYYSEDLESNAINYSYTDVDDNEVYPVKEVLRKVYPEITETTFSYLSQVQLAHDCAADVPDDTFITRFKRELKVSIMHCHLPEEYLCYCE